MVALVDVNALNGTTRAAGDILTGRVLGTTDRVIKNEDFGCTGSEYSNLVNFDTLPRLKLENLRIFQQLLGIRVILILNLLLINKQLLLALMIVQLKPVFVECII